MPFVNQAQNAACRAQAERDVAAGYKVRWNCDEYAHEKKRGETKTYDKEWIPLSAKEMKVYEGKSGGRYRLVDGHKYYSHQFEFPKSGEKEPPKWEVERPRKASRKSSSKKNQDQIFIGTRGGKYKLAANGRKIYQ